MRQNVKRNVRRQKSYLQTLVRHFWRSRWIQSKLYNQERNKNICRQKYARYVREDRQRKLLEVDI